MLRALLFSISLSTAALSQPAPPPQPPQPAADKLIFVKMTTTAGDIILELNNEKAPITVANFLKYADSKAYDGNIFHRVIPWFVIQGGGYTVDLTELKGEPAIKNEWNNGLKNTRGTIAMARDAEPNTATREFYINVADNPRLDTARPTTGNAGYAVFGRVIAGMEVVDHIRDGVTTSRPDPNPDKSMDDLPTAPISITGITRLSLPDAQAKSTEAKPGRPLWKLWRFDDGFDAAPVGFSPAETAGKGTLAQWRITKPTEPLKPSSPPASLHVTTSNTGGTFNLLLADGAHKDLSLFVRIHSDIGIEDLGGGLVWRATDADNYYLARWNPLEGNFRLYIVQGGKRTQLATVDVVAEPNEWHRIRIDHSGSKISAAFDGKTVLTADDAKLPGPGKIGLWTKADASSWFDDLAVVDRE